MRCLFFCLLVAQTAMSEMPADNPEANLQDFKEHFTNNIAGRPEALFMVKVKKCPIYAAAGSEKIVGYLEKNDDVHALAVSGEWVQISKHKFVLKKHLRNLGLKTLPKI